PSVLAPPTPRSTLFPYTTLFRSLFAASATAALLLATSASAAELTVGFSQIGSESGWRAAETSVSKSEAAKRKINLKIADAQQKRSEEHTSELQSRSDLVCRLLLE